MPDDAHVHPDLSPKSEPPARPDEMSESHAPAPPARHRAPATSETSLPAFSNIQNPPPAKTAARLRNNDPTPEVPTSAARPAHRTDCCPACFDHPRRASTSSAESKHPGR